MGASCLNCLVQLSSEKFGEILRLKFLKFKTKILRNDFSFPEICFLVMHFMHNYNESNIPLEPNEIVI